MQESIVDIFKYKYPELAARVEVVRDGSQVAGEIPFHNPRYRLWFVEDGEGYIVGINFLQEMSGLWSRIEWFTDDLKRPWQE